MNANQEFVDEVIVEFLTLLLYTVPPKKIIWILVKTKPVTAHGADVRYIKIIHTVLVYTIASIPSVTGLFTEIIFGTVYGP